MNTIQSPGLRLTPGQKEVMAALGDGLQAPVYVVQRRVNEARGRFKGRTGNSIHRTLWSLTDKELVEVDRPQAQGRLMFKLTGEGRRAAGQARLRG